jgi:assimilatory nitrate reductase electron transfer subunit
MSRSGSRRVVVVGNGMAGSRVADEIAQRDAAGNLTVTVLGREPRPAYNRILLSSVLAGESTADDIRLAGPQRSGSDHVTVRTGTCVRAVDRRARTVVCDDGTDTPYDQVVLATGSSPVVPPLYGLVRGEELLPGASVFRTVEDCRAIEAAAVQGRRAVVLGGGILGVEAARGLVARGLEVEVLHAGAHLMDRQLDPAAAEMLTRTLATLGVAVRVGVRAVGVAGRECLEGVVLDDGTVIDADVLVVACGVRPDTALARQAGLRVDRGVVVDGALRSVTDPDVHALGDCAQHDGTVYGLVAPAWEQAGVLADRLTGRDPTARYRGSRQVARLKAAGVDLASMGETRASDTGAEVVQFVDSSRGTYQKVVIQDGHVVGAVLLGEIDSVGTLTQMFDRGAPVPTDRRHLLFGRLASAPVADNPAHLPSDARLCQCNGVSKGDIRACWLAGARTVDAVATATRATTGCGSCRDAVEGVLAWMASAEPEPVAGLDGAVGPGAVEGEVLSA